MKNNKEKIKQNIINYVDYIIKLLLIKLLSILYDQLNNLIKNYYYY